MLAERLLIVTRSAGIRVLRLQHGRSRRRPTSSGRGVCGRPAAILCRRLEKPEDITESALAIKNEELQLAESQRQYRAFLTARLLLVGLFIGLWVLLLALRYPMPPGVLGVLVIEGTALAGFLGAVRLARDVRALQHLHYAQLVVEFACHTAIVYFLGGVSWLGALAYIYALMYAVVFLSWRQVAVFTAAVVAAYLAVVSLDGTGLIPHQWYLPQGPDRYQNTEFLVTTSIAFAGVLATITFWMVFIGNELRRERDFALASTPRCWKFRRNFGS